MHIQCISHVTPKFHVFDNLKVQVNFPLNIPHPSPPDNRKQIKHRFLVWSFFSKYTNNLISHFALSHLLAWKIYSVCFVFVCLHVLYTILSEVISMTVKKIVQLSRNTLVVMLNFWQNNKWLLCWSKSQNWTKQSTKGRFKIWILPTVIKHLDEISLRKIRTSL